MRIAQVAPLAESVPPKLYGGTERVVAWLVDELVDLGHEVTLFASGDSKTTAKLNAVWPRALRLGRPRTDPMVAQAALLEAVARHAAEFDVIHAHIDWLHLPLLSRLGVPFVSTCHGRMDLPGFPDVVRRFPDAPFVSISDNQRVPLSEANWSGTIYHGLPADLFRPSFERGSYLAFLGRLTAEKGPEAAIRIAHAAKMPLRIAAKVPRGVNDRKIRSSFPDLPGDLPAVQRALQAHVGDKRLVFGDLASEQGQRLFARRQNVRLEAALSEEILHDALQRVIVLDDQYQRRFGHRFPFR
jgi:glycosyltransferase involved in cell wall biosynthesis